MTVQADGKNPTIIKLHGIITSGVGEGCFFTEVPWIKSQFIDKLGINTYPGTLNIKVLREDVEKLESVRKATGVEIVPEDKDFCAGKCFQAIINGKIRGAVVIPLVLNYPADQLEIIADKNIKQALSLQDGDLLEVEVYI